MIAVVVRCHDPSPAAASRLSGWAADCAAANIDFVVSLDNTQQWRQTPRERRVLKRKRENSSGDGCASQHTSPPSVSPTHRLNRTFAESNANVHVHRYTESDLLHHFPGLVPLQKYLLEEMKVREMVTRKCTMAWGFHVEALILWWVWSQKKMKKYKYIWVFEDDVGITGNIANLVKEYKEVNADILTDHAIPMNEEWYWKDVHTENFFTMIGGAGKICAREHVQRMSHKLMERLTTLCMKHQVHAWSEAFTSSVAHHASDLTVSGFHETTIGDPYKWNGRVSEEDWSKIVEEEEGELPPRLFHALKF